MAECTGYLHHRVHRVATAAFWCTFSDEGKIRPGWWGWGVHAHPLSLHLPLPVKLQCTLHLSGQIHWPCFISTNICTLWPALSAGAYTVGEYTGKDLRFFLSSYSAPPSPPPSKLAPRSCTCCTQRRKTKREEGVQEFEQNKMTAKNVGLFKCIPSTVLGTLFCLLAGPEENLL
jgi:hypothetical protein